MVKSGGWFTGNFAWQQPIPEAAGCYSNQTFKHINLRESHLAGVPAETFADIRLDTANCLGRMGNLRASVLRPCRRNAGHGTTAVAGSIRGLRIRPDSG